MGDNERRFCWMNGIPLTHFSLQQDDGDIDKIHKIQVDGKYDFLLKLPLYFVLQGTIESNILLSLMGFFQWSAAMHET